MKVTVLNSRLNRRMGKPSINAPKLAPPLEPGTEIVTDGIVYTGDMVQGNNKWLKDLSGIYYWSGGTNYTMPPVPQLSFNGKKTFPWFDHLQIAEIWEKYNVRGEGVKVAVLDTGYTAMSDLQPLAATVLIEQEYYPGKVLTPTDEDTTDFRFHGTRCASLIGAKNNRDWIVGIAPQCDLLIGKISLRGSLLSFNFVVKGIEWAIGQGAEVISISFSKALSKEEAIDFKQKIASIMQNKKVLIFASLPAGVDLDFYGFPQFFSDYITIVGRSSLDGTVSSNVSQTDIPIICAPGDAIESFPGHGEPTPLPGSSFSTAIVAGIAALALSYIKNGGGTWDKNDFLNKINSTAIQAPNAKKRIIQPMKLFGVLNNLTV